MHNNIDVGVLDGSTVPPHFILVHRFPRSSVHTLELASDGYYSRFPLKPTVAAFEADRAWMELEDPHKYKVVLATKSTDDRTVIVASL